MASDTLHPIDDAERLRLIEQDLETAREALLRVMRYADALDPNRGNGRYKPMRIHMLAGNAILTVDDTRGTIRRLRWGAWEVHRGTFEDELERAS